MKRHSFIRTGIMGISAAVLGLSMTANAQTPAADWVGKLTFSGDARLRLNETEDAGVNNFSELVRARITTLAKVNDSITANLRLATYAASGEAVNTWNGNGVTSSNEPFGSYEAKKPFALDIASINYKIIDSLTLTGGKATNPFFKAGGNEMIFDVDVTLEGFNLKWASEYGMFKPFATIQQAQLVDHAVAADSTLVAAQIGSGFSFGQFGGTLAVAEYNYNNLKGEVTPYANGNSTNGTATVNGVTSPLLAREYRLTAVDLEVGMDVGALPLMLFGTYVTNSDGGDSGYLAGVRAGKLVGVNSWMAEYSYRDQQADAVLGAFTDSDFAAGQSNTRGHKLALAYGVMENTSLAANVFLANRYNAAQNGFTAYNRYQIDALVSF